MKPTEPKLTDQQLRFIEARYALREKEAEQRRKRQGIAFWIAMVTGFCAAAAPLFPDWFWFIAAILWLVFAISFIYFADFFPAPQSAEQDSDIRWHLNPWREGLQKLRGERLVRAIVLLAVPGFLSFLVKAFVRHSG